MPEHPVVSDASECDTPMSVDEQAFWDQYPDAMCRILDDMAHPERFSSVDLDAI
jgi:hypothetical protein